MNNNISNRKIEIIKFLIENKETNCKEIGLFLNVSDRTILNEIREINSIPIVKDLIKIERGRGVYINETTDLVTLTNFINSSYNSEETTIINLVKVLLINKFLEKKLFLDDLAEEFYVSSSKLTDLIKEVNLFLSEYELTVVSSKTYGTYIDGDEKNLRRCISDILFNRKSDYYKLFIENEILTMSDIDVIKEIIKKNLLKHGVELSYISFNNLVMHILISIFRKSYSIILITSEIDKKVFYNELNITKEIVRDIESKLGIDLSEDIFYLTENLISSQRLLEYDESKDIIDSKRIVKNIIDSIHKNLMIDFGEDEYLIESLELHLLTSYKRYKSKIIDKTIDLTDIKIQYPIAYDIGIIASEVINKELKVNLSDTEILLLAIHFGTSLYKSNFQSYSKNNILIICGTGLATAKFLKYSLISQFDKDISSVELATINDLDKKNLNQYDLILSNVDLDMNLPNYLRINNILTNLDYIELKEKLNKKNEVEINRYILEKNIFFTNLTDKDEWLNYLRTNLINRNILDMETYFSILDRERLGNTYIGNNVSIPHPLVYKGSNLQIIIFRNSNEIIWDSDKVNLIFLLLVPKEQIKVWDKLFKRLYPVINSPYLIEKIKTVKNPKELKDMLVREAVRNV